MTAYDTPLTKTFHRPYQNQFGLLLTALLAVDALFIGLYVARDFLLDAHLNIGYLASDRWLIERDRGFPEFFQYFKAIFAATLLLGLAARYRSAVYTAWGLVFSYVLIDDAFELHEAFGHLLLATLELPVVPGVGGYLYVEALLWGVVGSLLAGVAGYGRLRNHAGRRLSRQLACLFALFFLFAGVADAAHAYVDTLSTRPSYLLGAVTILEDGGEMVVLSVTAAWAYRHASATLPRVPRRS